MDSARTPVTNRTLWVFFVSWLFLPLAWGQDPGGEAFARARKLRDAKRFGPAIQSYEEALGALKRRDWRRFATYELSEVLSWERRFVESAQRLRRGLEEFGERADFLLLLARTQTQAKQNRDAVRTYERLLKLRPEDVGVRLEYAQALAWADEPERAEAEYTALLSADPSLAQAELGLAELDYWRLDKSAALARLEAYEALAGQDVESRALRAKVKAIRLNSLTLGGSYSRTVLQPDWGNGYLVYQRRILPRTSVWVGAEGYTRFALRGGRAELGILQDELFWKVGGSVAYARSTRDDFVGSDRIKLSLFRPLGESVTIEGRYEFERYDTGNTYTYELRTRWTHDWLQLELRYQAFDPITGSLGHGATGWATLAFGDSFDLLLGGGTGFDTTFKVTTGEVVTRRIYRLSAGARVRLGDFELEGSYAFQWRDGQELPQLKKDSFTRHDLLFSVTYRF